jgi:enediyne biosynthesis protein E4
MSGGVVLIDYDGDGWRDIYFTNAQSVNMALHGVRSRSALFHNNHDGTFTDVTDKAGAVIRAGRWALLWATTTMTAGRTCL